MLRRLLATPALAGWLLLGVIVLPVLFTLVVLTKANLGGLVPLVPAALGGVYITVRWFSNWRTVIHNRQRDEDFERELKALLDDNYL